MIISISGVPGSGKTSAAKMLAARLGMPFYSVGGLRGKMAMERGMTIDELNALGEKDATTDTTIDDYQRELGKKEDHFVIEGRLSWHFIPHSFKVLLTCDPQEAARRIFDARARNDGDRHDEAQTLTIEETRAQLDHRIESDRLRYKKYYNLDYQDPSHYDLVIDTTSNGGPERTMMTIAEAIEKTKLP